MALSSKTCRVKEFWLLAKEKAYPYINDIANSKLLLYSANFTESSYNYTASVWRCPVKLVEQEEKAKKESSLASRLLSFFLGCARIDAKHRKGCSPLYGAPRRKGWQFGLASQLRRTHYGVISLPRIEVHPYSGTKHRGLSLWGTTASILASRFLRMQE